jgi:hypothetical protein
VVLLLKFFCRPPGSKAEHWKNSIVAFFSHSISFHVGYLLKVGLVAKASGAFLCFNVRRMKESVVDLAFGCVIKKLRGFMNHDVILYGVIAALTVLSLGLGAWLFYLKFIARPTREKYAFTALFALTSLVALAFTTAFYQTPWTAIMGLIAHYAGLPAPQFEELNSSDKVLIFLFVSWMAWLIQRTFSQWNGAISENQAEQQKRHEEVLFISEGIKMLLGKYEEKDLQLHNQTDYSKQLSALEVPSDSLAWRIQAIELLTLRWHGYYRFETENDENWHEKARCWLGKNVKENKTVAVFCCRQQPNDAEIQAFTDYVRSLGNKIKQCELLIITQQGEAEKIYTLENSITIHQYSEALLLDGLVDFEDYL